MYQLRNRYSRNQKVLLFLRRRDDAFFDVIADHRRGDFRTANGQEIAVDVFGDLIQIKTDVGESRIARQMEARDRLRQAFYDFF